MNYDTNPTITALCKDDSVKKTLIAMLEDYGLALRDECDSADAIKLFIYQAGISEEDLVDALSHDVDYYSIAPRLKEIMDVLPKVEDYIDAYEYDYDYE
jgi:hypothetical protein